MRFIIRYDEKNDQCLVFSSKGYGMNNRNNDSKLFKSDKLLMKYYYSPRPKDTGNWDTPFVKCVKSFT